MRRIPIMLTGLALLVGGTAVAKAPLAPTGPTETAPTTLGLEWVQLATPGEVADAVAVDAALVGTKQLKIGVENRPPVMLRTNYYVYPYGGDDTPTVMLTIDDNGYGEPVTLWMYWQNRETGEVRYLANGSVLGRGVAQDIFGTAGTAVHVPSLDDFRLFGPTSAWGAGPDNPTGLYMFVFEVRSADGSELISRGFAPYSHVDGIVVVEDDVTTDTVWTNDNAYYLAKGGEDFPVHVGGKGEQGQGAIDPATLTIEPGTVVIGSKENLGTLSVSRGSKLIANGTPLLPIIMTSEFEAGQRSSGDWGGLVLNGFAPVNADTGEREGEGETGFFGGDDPHDSSGVLSYVRVEFAGVLFTTEDELNGIAFQGVGSGTVVSHVQVNRNADDGVEFFGGTVNADHLLLTGIEDDSIDWTYGWTGRLRNAVVWQGTQNGDQGIEADSDRNNPNREPRSMPKIFNATFVAGFGAGNGDLAALFRRGTGGIVRDAIFTGFEDCGLTVHDEETYDQIDAGNLVVANTIMFANTDTDCEPDEGIYFDADRLSDFRDPVGADNLFVDPGLADPFNPIVPDLRPLPDSAASDVGASGGSGYIGGLAPGHDWIYEAWTTWAQD